MIRAPCNGSHHALCPASKVCKSNSLCVEQPCPFTSKMEWFLTFFGQWKFNCCRHSLSGYRQEHIRPYISPGDQKHPFFVEPSRFVHRGHFRLTETNFRMTGSTSLVPIFAGSFLFVTESARQMFYLCFFQCWLWSPILFSPKSVSSNRTTWFNNSFLLP